MSARGWDWADPEDFFATHVAHRPRSFWLDGSGSRAWSGRMTYIGWLDDDEPSLTYHAASRQVTVHRGTEAEPAGGDVFAALGEISGQLTTGVRAAGWVGFFGYSARADLPTVVDHDSAAIDACWLRASRRIAFDHGRRRVYAVAPPDQLAAWRAELGPMLRSTQPAPELGEPPPAAVTSTSAAAPYAAAFDRVQQHLRLGNSYEANLTYRTTVDSAADPVDTYRRLRRLSPAPYAALLTHHGTRVLSSSPERFATIQADRMMETRPIKGTTARDSDPELDGAAAARLRADPKFVGENLMIVDLLRNDMSQVCEPGTVVVTDLMHVESYPAVHQLITTIEGRLRDDVDTLAALHALFPGGSMTGAPKLRTMEIIAEVESSPRGVYSGAIGWLLDDGSADLGIIIRTLVHRGGSYTLGTGGGITVRSTCDEEYDETRWKAANLLSALGL